MKYFVNEIQDNTSTTYVLNTIEEAEAKYHYILSFAAVSDVAIHGAILYDNYGVCLISKTYKHPTNSD